MGYYTLQEQLRSRIFKLRNDLVPLIVHVNELNNELKLKLNPINAELEKILKDLDELVELVKELKDHQHIKY